MGGGGGLGGERNSFNARALPRFISHLSRRESGSHWVLDGTVTRHLLSAGTRGASRGEGMPGRLPIGRSDTERLLDALLNFEPPEKQEVWLFSTVRKRKGRRSLWGWADMGTGGFGSSDGNRRREKRGRRGTSIPPSFCYVMLCYAMLCYGFCCSAFCEVWIWLHIWFTISVQFCPVNGALKKKIFTVNRTRTRMDTCVRVCAFY